MRFLPDSGLYASTEHCLQFLRTLDDTAESRPPSMSERFHLFWQGDFGAKQAFTLRALLATQASPHLDVWLWLEKNAGYPGHEANGHLQPLLERLTVRCFDADVEARDTPLSTRLDLYDLPARARSDFFRHVVLYRYGGVYLDFDIMLLRDLGLLSGIPDCDGEYCYAWSDRPYANTALLRLNQGGSTARALLDRCAELGTCHPKLVAAYTAEDVDLLVLPSAVVDPLWLTFDRKDAYPAAPFHRFEHFFEPLDPERARAGSRLESFCPGALAYHWHNCWAAPELDCSYFGLFRAKFLATCAALQP